MFATGGTGEQQITKNNTRSNNNARNTINHGHRSIQQQIMMINTNESARDGHDRDDAYDREYQERMMQFDQSDGDIMANRSNLSFTSQERRKNMRVPSSVTYSNKNRGG